jgi:hypothetical protein
MKITKFEIGAPDSDGDMYAELSLSVSNPTEHEIRWIQYSTAFLNKDGFALNGTNDAEEFCMLAPGEDIQCSTSDRVRAALAGSARNDLTAVVYVTMYTREFFKLGEVDVPASARACATLEKAIASQVIEGPLKLSLYRDSEDSDGQSQIELCINVASKVPDALGRAELKYFLLDAEDSTIEESMDSQARRGRSGGVISGSLYGLRKSQLRGARLRATLAVFREVHSATFTAKSTPSRE